MLTFIAAYEFTIIGLIMMLVIGPAIGNYACSVVYRLPRGKTPFERHPFCGHCNADLKPIDLAPILSWCMTRGKCRYCGGPIPGVYTVIELACLALFVTNFLRFGISETFLLLCVAGTFAIINAAIQYQQGWLSVTVYSYSFLALALERTRLEHSIYPWVKTAITVFLVTILLEKLRTWISKATFDPFRANWLWWAILVAELYKLVRSY